MLRHTFFASDVASADQSVRFDDQEVTLADELDAVDEQTDALELPLDMVRTGNKLIVRAPIVGAGIHDISVSLTPDRLTIQKNGWKEQPEEKEQPYFQECHWGALSRTIDLPKLVDPDRTRASLNDGVLTIIMPIASKLHTKIIKIQE